MMKMIPSRYVAGVLTLAVTSVLATPSHAQQTANAPAPTMAPVAIQVALANDVGTLGEKFEGLAKVMAGKYDWKPGEGVRSAGDVFNLIVNENKMLVGVLAGTGVGPAARGPRRSPTPRNSRRRSARPPPT